jgi:hypothetical protein
MRVGFLFNHDQIHQVAHSLPIAKALAVAHPGTHVVLALSNARIATEVERLLDSEKPANLEIIHLGLTSRSSLLLNRLFRRFIPSAKLLLYRDNLEFFRALDALVVTERTSLVLKTRYGLDALPMYLADHGAGDRAIGFGTSAAKFDHILAAGAKIRDRMIADAHVAPERITITGYPKFDTVKAGTPLLPMQANGRPTVLYNPHVSPHLSSWFDLGNDVLEYFYNSKEYNLIFAPHIMLFQRRFVMTIDRLRFSRVGIINKKYYDAPNIHIDLGSTASTNMTYTNAADIYLGDVSSQVYEFMRKPRPCIFLDTHKTPYEGDANYAHWQAGPVVSTISQLKGALATASLTFGGYYAAIQTQLFNYTFDLTEELSSFRAAAEIARLLGIIE